MDSMTLIAIASIVTAGLTIALGSIGVIGAPIARVFTQPTTAEQGLV